MHFARTGQLIVMALVWAVALLVYDHHESPRPLAAYWADLRGSSTRPTVVSEGDTPRVRLSLPHLCCTGCLGEIRAALAPLAWLAPARLVGDAPVGPPIADPTAASAEPVVEHLPPPAADGSTAHELDLDVLDLPRANFVMLEQAVHDTGLVPDRIEVSGLSHFRLEVEITHLCCATCSKAVDEQLQRFLQKETQGRWFDSMTADHVHKTITIYPRMNAVVDLLEIERALARAGFSARSVRILTGPES